MHNRKPHNLNTEILLGYSFDALVIRNHRLYGAWDRGLWGLEDVKYKVFTSACPSGAVEQPGFSDSMPNQHSSDNVTFTCRFSQGFDKKMSPQC